MGMPMSAEEQIFLRAEIEASRAVQIAGQVEQSNFPKSQGDPNVTNFHKSEVHTKDHRNSKQNLSNADQSSRQQNHSFVPGFLGIDQPKLQTGGQVRTLNYRWLAIQWMTMTTKNLILYSISGMTII